MVLAPLAALATLVGVGVLATAGPARATTTVVVSPANMQGWGFFDDNGNGGTGQMVTGPGTPPLGTGSAELAVANSTQGYALGTLAYEGTPLSSITNLSYWSYQPGPTLAIALQFDVKYRPTDTGYDGRLVYEPYQNGAVTVGSGWQQWSPLNGIWWASHQGPNGTNGLCPQSSPCLWSTILSDFPNATISGATLFKAGSGWSSFDGNVDAFTIGVSGNNTTYDFEPVLITANHCTGVLPPGTYQNVNAYQGCLIDGTDNILGNVTVVPGGTLQDGDAQNGGAPIGGNLQTNKGALWVDIGHAGTIRGNLQIQGLTSEPGPGATTDGATVNDVCGTTIHGDVQIQSNAAGAPFDVGGPPDCGFALTIGGNLQVQSNAGALSIGGAPNPTVAGYSNVANNNIQVQNNTGGGTLTDNKAGGNCQLGGDHPPITGSGNAAHGSNSCNTNA